MSQVIISPLSAIQTTTLFNITEYNSSLIVISILGERYGLRRDFVNKDATFVYISFHEQEGVTARFHSR